VTPKTAFTMLAVLACTSFLALPGTGALAAGGDSTGGTGVPTAHAHSSSTPSAAGVRATALATWFGPGLYGRRTACGQTLTPSVVGVANRRLPCGTLVKLTYAGHTLVAPVLDRGPYGRLGAEWDLTAGAASALGITETVRVGAHVVGSTPNSPTLGLPAGTTQAAEPTGGTVAGGTLAA
jgi:rare lipoprotein A (peptidoglycan hydrolase)